MPPVSPRSAVCAAALAAAGALVALPPGPAAAATVELRLPFEAGESLTAGSRVVDGSGRARHGTVLTGAGGALQRAPGWGSGTGARFPSPCAGSGCPKAVVEVPGDGLAMGLAAFEWGARVQLPRSSTSAGENVVQKGLAHDRRGQWKLQVDGVAGRPSCVVSGARDDGSYLTVTVVASVSVADGAWHGVTCRRTAGGVSVLVDGTVRGSRPMRPVRLTGTAPVRVGGKAVDRDDNDQFFGVLDEVVVRRL